MIISKKEQSITFDGKNTEKRYERMTQQQTSLYYCEGCCQCGKCHGHQVNFCQGCCAGCGKCHGHVEGRQVPPGTKLSKTPYAPQYKLPKNLAQISKTRQLDLRFDEKLTSLFDEKDRDFLEECVKLCFDGMKDLNHWNYNRTSFFNMIPKNLKKIVEVGSQCGKNAYRIFKVCMPQHLYLVDPWDRVSENPDQTQDTDIEYQIKNENCIRMFFDNKENITIMKNWSVEGATLFNNEELDFVYIDGDHAPEAVFKDLTVWSDKVRAGGFLGGHDYEQQNHIPSVVNDFLKYQKDFEFVYHPYINGRFSSDSSDSHSDFLLRRV